MNDSSYIVLGLMSFLLFVVLYLWMALALSGLFRKAGEEGWKGWVPVLNQIVLLKLGGFSPWLVLLLLIPIIGGVAYYVVFVLAAHRINAAFGYSGGMTVLAAFLPVIWASVLGFGSARWIGAPAAPVGPVGPLRSGADRPPAPPAPPAPAGWGAPPPLPAPGPAPAPAYSPVRGFGLDDDLEDSAVDPGDRLSPAGSAPAPAPMVPAAPAFAPPPLPPAPDAALATPATAAMPATPSAGSAGAEEPVVPIWSVPGTRSAQTAPPAPVPVERVPEMSPAPAPEPWAPVSSSRPAGDPSMFVETSEAVSAVVGAPDAGAPRSARSSVSALHEQPEIPGDAEDEGIDQTVIARRRRIPWTLIPPAGSPIDISSEVVILGRRPAPDPAYPGAQLVSIDDQTRTVSKTHARLELREDTWYVTDLGSTNGVLFATLMGTEIEAQPGQELEAGERFFLGDAEVRLRRSDA